MAKEYRVETVVLHLEDKVEIWYHDLTNSYKELQWEEFVDEFCKSFRRLTVINVAEEFNKLV